VRRRFPGGRGVGDLDLDVSPGEFHAILGPSGCGKSTLLRLIAGFERLDDGRILLDGAPVSGPGLHEPPERRRVGMVFQDAALFPHLSAMRNVLFGLRGEADAASRAQAMLDLTGVGALRDRMPETLSGGERQRVALARALAPSPRVVLLDEPFGGLDEVRRDTLRREVRRILKGRGTSAILVTHDRAEALSLADRVSVVFDGRLHQTGSPDEIYARPVTPEVALFTGQGTLLSGSATEEIASTELGPVSLRIPREGAVRLLVRPEQIRCGDGGVVVQVEERRFLGPVCLLVLRTPSGAELLAQVAPHRAPEAGGTTTASLAGPMEAWAEPRST
jgi:iron(III) transport system ATP-binding protein